MAQTLIGPRIVSSCIFCIAFFFFWSDANAFSTDSTKLKMAFGYLEEAIECYKNSPTSAHSTCNEIFKKAYNLSEQHAFFLEQMVSFLFSEGRYQEAKSYIQTKRVDTLSNSLQARHSHFKGIMELRAGFDFFGEAYQSFKNAYILELRSPYPSFKFLSQVQNAMGYTKLVYSGPNKKDQYDYPHTNWITSDLVDALRNFEQALYFDKENKNAQSNRDTLLSKIDGAGIDVEEIKVRIQPKNIETIKSKYVVEEKLFNDTLDKVNVNYLPNNKYLLVDILQKYEELLLVTDISGSMRDIHPKKRVSRFRLMRELVLFLFHELGIQTKMGIVTVGRGCKDQPALFYHVEMNARKDIIDEVSSIGPNGSTPLSFSIQEGVQLFSEGENRKAIFLISDGMETCGNPLDLCIIASNLHSMGIDVHVISFIVEGMEDSEFAYEIYNCMTQYSGGRVFQYDEQIEKPEPVSFEAFYEEKLLLPPISFGKNLRNIVHFVVDLTDYFPGEK